MRASAFILNFNMYKLQRAAAATKREQFYIYVYSGTVHGDNPWGDLF